jgi:hypothetical protein
MMRIDIKYRRTRRSRFALYHEINNVHNIIRMTDAVPYVNEMIKMRFQES